jgi:hypothetical protein
MRIRTVKPEFWRSDDIDALIVEDRLLFIGLWSYVDDSGVGVDKEAAIAADLFAGDLSRDFMETSVRVQGGLKRLHAAGLIERYEVDGRRFIHIVSFGKHQRINRPTPSRYPPPTSGNALPPEPSGSPHGELSEDSLRARMEQGNRGDGEQRNRGATNTRSREPRAQRADPNPDGFFDFWDAYPRKIGKRAALKAYASALNRGAEPAELLSAVRRFAAVAASSDPKFIPHATTWLNQGRYDDEPASSAPARATGTSGPQIGTSRERANAILALTQEQP